MVWYRGGPFMGDGIVSCVSLAAVMECPTVPYPICVEVDTYPGFFNITIPSEPLSLPVYYGETCRVDQMPCSVTVVVYMGWGPMVLL